MRVLYAVHALPAAGLGGTELYTERLAETLADEHEVGVATPRGHETDVAGATVYRLPDPADWTDPTGRASGLDSGVVHGAVDRRFADVLDEFDPDVVHFQHLKLLSATLPSLCAQRDDPCLLTLHDFWTACHREQLVRPPGTLCEGPESITKCTRCYADALGSADTADSPRSADTADSPGSADGADSPGSADAANSPGSADGADSPASAETADCLGAVRRRTERLRAAREACDLLVAPSEFLREQFVSFGTPPARIVHRRNGIRVEAFEDTGFDPDGPLRVGYAGRIARPKGVHVLVDAFERVEGDAELHVFGQFDPGSDSYHARLRDRAGGCVTFHGRYEAASTPYEASDLLAVPSLWYENSPLVVQEAFASRVPVVAGDVGGMAELVDHGEDGLTYPVGDSAALAECLRGLVDSPGTVRRLRAGIEPPTSLDEHAAELVELYAACRDRPVREVDPVA